VQVMAAVDGASRSGAVGAGAREPWPAQFQDRLRALMRDRPSSTGVSYQELRTRSSSDTAGSRWLTHGHNRGTRHGRARDVRRFVRYALVAGRACVIVRRLGLDSSTSDAERATPQPFYLSNVAKTAPHCPDQPSPHCPSGPRGSTATNLHVVITIHPEVADALAAGRPVVALESTIISHGLPRPDNLRVAREIEAAVRAGGAVPATIALVSGIARIGLDDAALEQIACRDDVVKVSTRDLAIVAARGGHGATTVAATAHLAGQVGIDVFATGGLGGVHRQARDTWDESADLLALASLPITVVCAGVKSILDVAATLERLETLGVAVLGFGTDDFPGFYLRDSGHRLDWRVETVAEVAGVMRARESLGTARRGLVVANPLPERDQLDPALHGRLLMAGLAAASDAGISGKDVTPFLLEFFHRESGGLSLTANILIILRNAALAAEIAVAASTSS
jgi:pseudouridine-5'-phosphate glycosidase